MISLDANIRNTKTKGELSTLRNNGGVPAVIYGGEAQNDMIFDFSWQNVLRFTINI